MKRDKRWILPLALALVAAMVGLISGCGPRSTPSTPQVTYPLIDLTPGSTWTYVIKGEGGETQATLTWTVIGTEEFAGDPDAVKVEQTVEGMPVVSYSYYKPLSNGIGFLGSEDWDVSGEPVLIRRSVVEELLVYPSSLKVGDVVDQSVQQTTQTYSGGIPDGPPTESTVSIAFTVAAVETVTFDGEQIAALKLNTVDGPLMWLGPNGMGVIKMTADGVSGQFLQSYDLN